MHGLNCVFLEMELQERFLVVNFPALLGAVAFSSIGVQSIINGWKWRVGGEVEGDMRRWIKGRGYF